MNYIKIYDTIVENRKFNLIKNIYAEEHHIIPKSLGGSSKKENIVRLTAREHFICHLLLTKIYALGVSHQKMIKAFGMMLWCENKETQQRYKINSHLYSKLREEFAIIQSEQQKGKKNSQYGKRWITNGIENRRIYKNENVPEHWRTGRILLSLRKQRKCKFCGKNIFGQRVKCKECIKKYREALKFNKIGSKHLCVVCGNLFRSKRIRSACSKKCSNLLASKHNKNNKYASKKIICIETNTIYNSLSDAANDLKCSISNISQVLSGKQKMSKGYTFSFI